MNVAVRCAFAALWIGTLVYYGNMVAENRREDSEREVKRTAYEEKLRNAPRPCHGDRVSFNTHFYGKLTCEADKPGGTDEHVWVTACEDERGEIVRLEPQEYLVWLVDIELVGESRCKKGGN